jgi:hypothetical protein
MYETSTVIIDGIVKKISFEIIDKVYKKNDIFKENKEIKQIVVSVETVSLESFGQIQPGLPGIKYDYYCAKLENRFKNNEIGEKYENYFFKTINKNY